MKRKNFIIVSVSFIFLLLFLGGCSHTVEQTAGNGDADGLMMKATFEREDGTPLSDCTVRFSDGENSADYQSDQNGMLMVSGLPAEGSLIITILDGQEKSQGTITLNFSQGAVIDAVTDESSVGHVTLTGDTHEIALRFTLRADGALGCQLQLSESRTV